MIRIIVQDTVTGQQAETTIPEEHAGAFRASIGEIRNEVGERLAGSHRFPKEFALTRAVSALGRFAAALNTVVLEDDKDYE